MQVIRHRAVRKNCELLLRGELQNLRGQQREPGWFVQARASIGRANGD
jgi:hypothetical protein